MHLSRTLYSMGIILVILFVAFRKYCRFKPLYSKMWFYSFVSHSTIWDGQCLLSACFLWSRPKEMMWTANVGTAFTISVLYRLRPDYCWRLFFTSFFICRIRRRCFARKLLLFRPLYRHTTLARCILALDQRITTTLHCSLCFIGGRLQWLAELLYLPKASSDEWIFKSPVFLI